LKGILTPETTEQVSSHGVEKRFEGHQCQRIAPFAREQRTADWKNGLQTYGAGRESRKSPTLVVGKKPNGEYQSKSSGIAFLELFETFVHLHQSAVKTSPIPSNYLESNSLSAKKLRPTPPTLYARPLKSCARLAALFLGAFSYLLLHPLDTAAAFQISASGTRTNLHLTATTVPGARLLWLSGNRVDGITNVAQIETTPVAQHDFQLPATSSSQFFRAVMIDTNVERTPFAITSAHALAILTNGTIMCWGDNSLGQFGNQAPKQYVGMGTIVACWYPSSGYINDSAGPLPQSTDTDWISVAAGTDYCLALKTDGSLWAWGNDASGGLGYAVPGGFYGGFYAFAVPVGTNATWQSVFAFGESSFAIRADGTLWAWGDNTDSVLGVGSNYMSTNVVFLPTQVGTASNWVKVVSFPRNFSMGIQSDGSLWSWGSTTLPSYVRASYAQTNLTLPVTVSPAPVNIPGPWVDVGFNLTSFVRGTLLRADGTLWAVTTNADDYGNWQVYETYFQNQYTNPGSIYNILIGAGATPADALTYVTGEFYQIYPFLLSFNFDYAAFLQKTSDAEFLQPYSSRSNWTMLASGIALNQDGTIWTLGEGVTRSPTSPKDGDWQRVNADTDWRYVSAGYGAARSGAGNPAANRTSSPAAPARWLKCPEPTSGLAPSSPSPTSSPWTRKAIFGSGVPTSSGNSASETMNRA
jgi:Regulator of chromosome condensation (RCC1) repeat